MLAFHGMLFYTKYCLGGAIVFTLNKLKEIYSSTLGYSLSYANYTLTKNVLSYYDRKALSRLDFARIVILTNSYTF